MALTRLAVGSSASTMRGGQQHDTRQRHALCLPAQQLGRLEFGQVLHRQSGQRVGEACSILRLASRALRHCQVGAHGQRRAQLQLLRQKIDAYGTPNVDRYAPVFGQQLPNHAEFPGSGPQQTRCLGNQIDLPEPEAPP